MKKYILFLAIIGFVLIGAGCRDDARDVVNEVENIVNTTTDNIGNIIGPENTSTTSTGGNNTGTSPTGTEGRPATSTQNAEVSAKINNFQFQPQSMTISRGTTVTWTNNDDVAHTVTANDGQFDSGNIENGRTFKYTFDKAGTYNYYCKPHPNMKGTVVVK